MDVDVLMTDLLMKLRLLCAFSLLKVQSSGSGTGPYPGPEGFLIGLNLGHANHAGSGEAIALD